MLTIIIPTYNEGEYLPKLLESIKKQDIKDMEVIVADNDSKDKTRKIAKKFGCRIVKGGLPGEGRNNGAKKAKGDVLIFLDADVKLRQNFIDECLEEFERRNLDVATCFLKIRGRRGSDKFLISLSNLLLFLTQKLDPHATGSFIICKNKTFKRLRGFAEKLKQAEDHDFVKRASKTAKFGVLHKSVYLNMRRFNKEGRMNVLKKYLKSEIYRKIKGDIKNEIFDYEYGKF